MCGLANFRHERYMNTMNLTITRSGAALALIATAAVWGVSFPAVQYALKAGIDVGLFMSLRFAIAAAGLGAICVLARSRFSRRLILDSAALGVMNFVAFWLQTDGLRFTTNAKAAFLTSLYVLITPLVAFCLGDRLRRSEFLAVPAAVLGLLGLFWNGGDPLGAWTRGDTEMLGCAFLFAGMILSIDRLSRRHDVLAMSFIQIAVMAALSTALLILSPPPDLAAAMKIAVEPGVILSLVFNGLIATALAFWVQCVTQTQLGATEAAILLSLEPLFATLLAVSGWVPGIHETMTLIQWAGGALLLLASFIAGGGGAGSEKAAAGKG